MAIVLLSKEAKGQPFMSRRRPRERGPRPRERGPRPRERGP